MQCICYVCYWFSYPSEISFLNLFFIPIIGHYIDLNKEVGDPQWFNETKRGSRAKDFG